MYECKWSKWRATGEDRITQRNKHMHALLKVEKYRFYIKIVCELFSFRLTLCALIFSPLHIYECETESERVYAGRIFRLNFEIHTLKMHSGIERRKKNNTQPYITQCFAHITVLITRI